MRSLCDVALDFAAVVGVAVEGAEAVGVDLGLSIRGQKAVGLLLHVGQLGAAAIGQLRSVFEKAASSPTTKNPQRKKIDGAVTMIMSLDGAIRCGGEGSSVYDNRGLVIL